MTFDDDFIRLKTDAGDRNYSLKALKLEWPPPELIELPGGFIFERVSYSAITDAQRSTMQFVCRGAEYRPKI